MFQGMKGRHIHMSLILLQEMKVISVHFIIINSLIFNRQSYLRCLYLRMVQIIPFYIHLFMLMGHDKTPPCFSASMIQTNSFIRSKATVKLWFLNISSKVGSNG